MGFSAETMNDSGHTQYIGTKSMMSMANAGAFDSKCTDEHTAMMELNEDIIAVVEKESVLDMIKIAEKVSHQGRWIDEFIAWAKIHGEGGIIVRY